MAGVVFVLAKLRILVPHSGQKFRITGDLFLTYIDGCGAHDKAAATDKINDFKISRKRWRSSGFSIFWIYHCVYPRACKPRNGRLN